MFADFWERLILAVVGPLLTALVGTLIIGLFVAWVTRRGQQRCADIEREEDRIRAEHALRISLIDQMSEAASGLYIYQHFWRMAVPSEFHWRRSRNCGTTLIASTERHGYRERW